MKLMNWTFIARYSDQWMPVNKDRKKVLRDTSVCNMTYIGVDSNNAPLLDLVIKKVEVHSFSAT